MKTNTTTPEQITKVFAKDLNTNHKLRLEDGSWQRITSVEKGFFSFSKLVHYKDGRWSCLLEKEKVEVIVCD